MTPFYMGNVIIFKATQHMNNGVYFADVGKELIARDLHLWMRRARGQQYQQRKVGSGW